MKNEDLKVIQKVAENFSKYKWYPLHPGSNYYKAIEFPIEAEDRVNAFYAEIFEGITVVVGAYLSRFYFEEDKYTWEKKCYAAIVANKAGGINSIAFITSEDVESQRRKNSFFKSNIPFALDNESQENTIIRLYDLVNRKVNQIDDLYTKFLESE